MRAASLTSWSSVNTHQNRTLAEDVRFCCCHRCSTAFHTLLGTHGAHSGGHWSRAARSLEVARRSPPFPPQGHRCQGASAPVGGPLPQAPSSLPMAQVGTPQEDKPAAPPCSCLPPGTPLTRPPSLTGTNQPAPPTQAAPRLAGGTWVRMPVASSDLPGHIFFCAQGFSLDTPVAVS